MTISENIIYVFLFTGAVASFAGRKLTLAGSVTGFFISLLIYKGAGLTGIAMLALFFIAGSWATRWQVKAKQVIGAAEENKGRRTAGQVLANSGAAAILGGLAWCNPAYADLFKLMMAGSLASATADTLSSELGMIYGRRFFNIISFKRDKRGLDGVVSLEGSLIGIVGAALIAAAYSLGFNWSLSFVWIVIAGFVGNLADSILGATLERRGIIGNNVVNFLNTFIGAMICWMLSAI